MASPPSQPVTIKSPRSDVGAYFDDALSPTGRLSTTPDLRVIRAQYAGGTPPPQIPLRPGTTPTQGASSLNSGSIAPRVDLSRRSSYGSGVGGGSPGMRYGTPPTGTGEISNLALDGLTDEDKAKILRRHLVTPEDRRRVSIAASETDKPAVPGSSAQSRRSSGVPAQHVSFPAERENSDSFPIPYEAQGADVTHEVYKWHADQRKLGARQRAVSYAGIPAETDPAFEHIHEPGGFRRNYLMLRANEQGVEQPTVLNNFIDFLFIFGHFAGEDLEEDEDEDEDAMGEDTEGQAETDRLLTQGADDDQPSERTPLVRRSTLRRSRSRRRSVGHQGDASVTQAVLMLLKSFVGTGILFLGKAFANGGVLFSTVTIMIVALISLYSFLLLVKAKFAVPGSFGDIGGELYGPYMRYAILTSIVISQLGFCAAYTIFVAESLQAFILGVTHCLKLFPVQTFILLQVIFFLPMALIRDIAKLSTTALVADVFILAGLVYIFSTEIGIIVESGIADVALFNKKEFPLFIGTAVFSFEGIGLIVPITDSMREPHKFPRALTGVMIFVMFLFGGGGALSYLAYGSKIQTVVLVNLDPTKKMVQVTQFLYSMAILLSIPLQFFPAIRILETGLFTRSGKSSLRVKWQKNAFRFGLVAFSTVISFFGAADLDKFVAFVGSFACIPLCYIYPAMLHLRACARTRRERFLDYVMIAFGSLVAVYMTVQTIRLMVEPEPAGGPKFGNCPPPKSGDP
ncbi:transmembrane amino acid transporter protein-domain-containing protein [Pterulicium gracile]|uniref:Transmembrane amino acid transporter protein-domain-containing protein n=1 Tax=Pterulicium gracile TaxID=1884261 RepID=A0A5C3QP66_9AGAR|nr:transmembrane amino acid transporter protein-domain-containing protein [Pterula gracilis]